MTSEKLDLQEVISLGGTAEDIAMLKDKKAMKNKKQDNFSEEDFGKLVKELGFRRIREPSKSVKTEHSKEVKKTVKSKTIKKKEKQSSLPVQDDVVSSTTDVKNARTDHSSHEVSEENFKFGNLPHRVLIKLSGLWHEISSPAATEKVAETSVTVLKAHAQKLLDNEIKFHKEKASGKTDQTSNDSWMKTISTAGTLSDRISALSLMVQEDPIHNFQCLQTLLSMMKKKGRREAIMGLEAIRDLLLGDILPNNRKLKCFSQQPLHLVVEAFKIGAHESEWSRDLCQRKLILWKFEDNLKDLMKSVVDHLKVLGQDTLEVTKTKAMKVALNLLLSKPEQEKSLLVMLVNKLGDPKYKIASKALHMLNSVAAQHPLMQGIIVKEVRDLLLRPNLAPRAQYYCVCFLSSQILSTDRKDVAKKLIQIYMSFFKSFVKKHSADNKMLSALLTGVNRAFPYADVGDEEISEELDILFRTVHVAGLSATIQALMLLFQVFNSRHEVSDRFYNALYASLLHHELPVSTHRHAMFLNLVYRAVKADPCEPRVQAFAKRLLQLCSLQKPPFCAAALVLLSQLAAARPSLAFSFLGQTNVGEENSKDDDEKTGNAFLDNADEEEHFVDVKETSDADDSTSEDKEKTKSPAEAASSWTHKHKEQMRRGASGYSTTHRNPQYAGADRAPLWELHSLTRHFHPTVSLYAKELTENTADVTSRTGNPLDDYTLMKFLDKFVYRNPKSQDKKQGKKNAPLKIQSAHRRRKHETFNDVMPVNSLEFLRKKDVAPDEVFFHKYFSSQAGMRSRDYESRGERGDSDDESVTDEDFEKFMHSADGQRQIDEQLNFANHIYKNKKSTKRSARDAELDDDDESDDDDDIGDLMEDDEGDYGFEMEEGEEDLLAEAGTFETDEAPSPKKKAKSSKSSGPRKDDVEKFGMMLEENAQDKFDSISSFAVSNKDRSSAKQLMWEKQQNAKDIVARKRQRNRHEAPRRTGHSKSRQNSHRGAFKNRRKNRQ